jgi:hypothetical protein
MEKEWRGRGLYTFRWVDRSGDLGCGLVENKEVGDEPHFGWWWAGAGAALG